ncbi:MAG: S-layer homology domain-containing protein [Oscillospiraceae bacterium]|jgi:hypothetical protein|nr:S-layer homology domain-containing protein [Oscillospiraceae bacterium]
MKKTLICFLLISCLLLGVTVGLATAGGEDDPLISMSWAKTWADNLVTAAAGRAKTDLTAFGKTAVAASKNHPVTYTTSYTLISGATMELGEGCSLVLSSGSARINIVRGSLVNTTTGQTVSSGDLTLGQMYIVCEASAATVTTAQSCVILAGGKVKTSGIATFSDVGTNEWFYPYVTRGVALGLIHGMTETTFAPDRTLTVAETITLAAQLHRLNSVGNTTIPTSGTVWYDTYRTYCLQQGIIDAGYADYSDTQMNAPATRSEFVHIFYHAMPEDSLTAINAIPNDAIPDLKMTDVYADEIYMFYRAGILSGYTNSADYADHAFGPGTSIRRNEMAVILVHLADASTRVSFTIE